MKGMKIVILFVMLTSMFSCASGHMDFDFSPYSQPGVLGDGEFIGEVSQGLDRARVKVVVLEGEIVEVDILSVVAFGWRKKAVKNLLPSQIVEKQGIDIDGITGATGSTHAVRIAVSRALDQSLAD